MIELPTVFILGAGASVPFGFPSGRKLLEDICQDIDNVDSKFKFLLRGAGFQELLITRFREELYLSKMPSVDLFLEKRPEYVEIGKAAISCALIPYEKPDALSRRANAQSWYEYLFSKLETNPAKFHENRLSVITFNYDRSLEYFLFSALKYSYGLNDTDAAQTVFSIPIYHVYGQLGEFPFRGLKNERHYDSQVEPENVRLCAACIKVISEDKGDSSEFSKYHELILKAKRVCFLGFGFHKVNVERLMSKVRQELTNNSQWKTFYGSAYDIREGERHPIEYRFDNRIKLGKENEDVLDYLRNNKIFFS
ncbi:SIR2 family protein [candidate division KSB1 bacterium]|nr:SIR2 family protein [candidate division KSB1 bacterium]